MMLALYFLTIHWASGSTCKDALAGSRRAMIEIFVSSNFEFPQTVTATRFQLIAHALKHPPDHDLYQPASRDESRDLVDRANRAHQVFGAKVLKYASHIQDGALFRLAGDLEALEKVPAVTPADRLALATRLDEYFRSTEYATLAKRLRMDLGELLKRRATKPRRAWRTTVSADAQRIAGPHTAAMIEDMLATLERAPAVSRALIDYVKDTLRH